MIREKWLEEPKKLGDVIKQVIKSKQKAKFDKTK